ncbi:hypothetical protein FRC00_000095, partial [Tulasnella sp. 408]
SETVFWAHRTLSACALVVVIDTDESGMNQSIIVPPIVPDGLIIHYPSTDSLIFTSPVFLFNHQPPLDEHQP